MYEYQDKLVKDTFNSLMTKRHVVLAACPGAGKTVMAIRVIDEYLEKYPKAKVLILAHGQTLLRSQWNDRISKFSRNKDFTELKRKCNSNARIIVALPHGHMLIKRLLKHVDLLVIDEAHHYYNGQMIKSIIRAMQVKHQLLLTGTPSNYVNKPDWTVIGITLKDLLTTGSVVDPIIELIKSENNFNIKNYNSLYNLKETVKFKQSKNIDTLRVALDSLIIQGRVIGKTLIVCASQKQAKVVYTTLKSLGHKSHISISDVSEGSKEFDLFRKDGIPFLVVVGRGILGFDYDGLMNIIDMTESLNINKLFQLLCRVVRRGGNDRKRFIKLISKEVMPIGHFVMSYVVAMSHPKYYFSYETQFKKQKLTQKIPIRTSTSTSTSTSVSLPDIPKVYSFTEVNEAIGGNLQRVAYTDFKTVLRNIKIENGDTYSYDQLIELVTEMKRQGREYKELFTLHKKAYAFASNHGYLADIQRILPKQQVAHTLERCIQLASECKTPTEFHRKHQESCKWMKSYHMAEYDKAFKNKRLIRKRLTDQDIIRKAKESKTLSEFWLSSEGSFTHRNNKTYLVQAILDKILPQNSYRNRVAKRKKVEDNAST